jgi:carbon starvation protein CstA
MKKVFIGQIIVNMIIILIFVLVLTKTTDIVSFTICIMPIVFEVFVTIKYIYKTIIYIKSFDKQTLIEIEKAIQQPIFNSIDYVLTDKFIFNKCNLEIIKYSDIYLIKEDLAISFGRMSKIYNCVYIVTSKGNYCLKSYKSNFMYTKQTLKRDLVEFLLAQNKKILIDDTKENIKKLKEKYNIVLKNNWKQKAKRTRKLIRLYI